MNPDFPPLRASAADLPALVELLAAVPGCLPETVWQLPWTWPSYRVIRCGDAIVASGSLQELAGGLGEIRGLVVHPDHQARGHASTLVKALLGDAERRGLTPVCVTRKPGFFKRHGFQETPTEWLVAERRLPPLASAGPRIGMVCR